MKTRKKLTKVGKYFFEVLLCVSICALLYSSFMLVKGFLEYKKGLKQYQTLVAEVVQVDTTEAVEQINFQQLQEMNGDIVGWIKLEDSIIDYPVVQGEDNEYYLTHLFDRSKNNAGCIFMDTRNQSGLLDRNTAFYGHNMKNGSIFADIEKYRSQDWYDRHQVIYYETPYAYYEILPFAGLLSDGYTDYVKLTFEDNDAFMDYVKEMRMVSTFVSDVKIENTDHIVTLSTCRYDIDAGRFALFGKLVKIRNK